jgi:hypothetical protein
MIMRYTYEDNEERGNKRIYDINGLVYSNSISVQKIGPYLV